MRIHIGKNPHQFYALGIEFGYSDFRARYIFAINLFNKLIVFEFKKSKGSENE